MKIKLYMYYKHTSSLYYKVKTPRALADKTSHIMKLTCKIAEWEVVPDALDRVNIHQTHIMSTS